MEVIVRKDIPKNGLVTGDFSIEYGRFLDNLKS